MTDKWDNEDADVFGDIKRENDLINMIVDTYKWGLWSD